MKNLINIILFFTIAYVQAQRSDLLPIITTMPNSDRVMVLSGSNKTITKANFLSDCIDIGVGNLTTTSTISNFANSQYLIRQSGNEQLISGFNFAPELLKYGLSRASVSISPTSTDRFYFTDGSGNLRYIEYSELFSGGGASLNDNVLKFDGGLNAYRFYNSATEAGIGTARYGKIWLGSTVPDNGSVLATYNGHFRSHTLEAYGGQVISYSATSAPAIQSTGTLIGLSSGAGINVNNAKSIDVSAIGHIGIFINKTFPDIPFYSGGLQTPAFVVNNETVKGDSYSDYIYINDNPSTIGSKGGAIINTIIGGVNALRLAPRINDTINELAYKFATNDSLSNIGTRIASFQNGSYQILGVYPGKVIIADTVQIGTSSIQISDGQIRGVDSIQVGSSWFNETSLAGGGVTAGNGIDITGNVISLNDTSLITLGANVNLETNSATLNQQYIANGTNTATEYKEATNITESVEDASTKASISLNDNQATLQVYDKSALRSTFIDIEQDNLELDARDLYIRTGNDTDTVLQRQTPGVYVKRIKAGTRTIQQTINSSGNVTTNVASGNTGTVSLGSSSTTISNNNGVNTAALSIVSGTSVSAGVSTSSVTSYKDSVNLIVSGQSELVTKANKVQIEDTMQSRYAKGSLTGVWDELAYIIKPPHSWGQFSDSTRTIALTQNVWAQITNPADSIFRVLEQYLMTWEDDTVTANIAGHYNIDLTISFTGTINDVFEVRIMSTDGELHKVSVGTDGTAPHEAYVPAYWIATAGEELWCEIRNTASSDDATVRSGGLRILYIHR